MGEVHKARDTRLDRTVAIKVLPAADDPHKRERFDREATLQRATFDDSQALVTIRYLVMEYLEGETLATRLARGPQSIAEAVHVAVQIASALQGPACSRTRRRGTGS